MSGPTFICPGAQKAGTTWLHRKLKRHPDFWMPPQKEVDYLGHFPASRKKYAARLPQKREQLGRREDGAERLAWWELFTSDWSLDKYTRLFDPARGRFSGDVSPNYSTLTAGEIVAASKIVPRAKIVILLRNPVERAWSHARHTITRSGSEGLSEEDRLAKMGRFAMSQRCLANGDYVTIIRNWQDAFGAEQVHVAFYDDLVTNPVNMLNGILEFVGSPRYPSELENDLYEVANKGESYACPVDVRERLSEYYAPMVRELRKMLADKSVPDWIGTGEGFA